MSKPKLRRNYQTASMTLDEKINRLLARVSVDNPPTTQEGRDLYLDLAAKALGMTYAAARAKFDNKNPAVRAARANVKNKLFSIIYGGGMSLI